MKDAVEPAMVAEAAMNQLLLCQQLSLRRFSKVLTHLESHKRSRL
jgi:hypothetical protein